MRSRCTVSYFAASARGSSFSQQEDGRRARVRSLHQGLDGGRRLTALRRPCLIVRHKLHHIHFFDDYFLHARESHGGLKGAAPLAVCLLRLCIVLVEALHLKTLG